MNLNYFRYNQLVSKNFKVMEELRERAPYDRVVVHPLVQKICKKINAKISFSKIYHFF